MLAKGTVKILSDVGWQEVPQYHRWTVKIGPAKTEVEFALHADPKGGQELRVCEVTTGCDTQAKVIHPNTGRIVEMRQLYKGRRNYLPGNEVRKLGRNAVHRLIQAVGELNFLTAMAIQSLSQHKPVPAQEDA